MKKINKKTQNVDRIPRPLAHINSVVYSGEKTVIMSTGIANVFSILNERKNKYNGSIVSDANNSKSPII